MFRKFPSKPIFKDSKTNEGAFDICQPSGYLGEEESALAQCFMAIAGFVRKMSGTSEVDTDTMNRAVSKMVEEALKYNQVESVLESGEEEDIFLRNILKNYLMSKCRQLNWNCLLRCFERKLRNMEKSIG